MTEKKGTKNMTVGSPKKHIVMFAIPIFFSQLFQTLYNSVDSMIVGKFLGDEALAAVSSSGNLIFLVTSFFTGTAMGAGVVISRYFGAKEYDRMSKAIHTNVAFGVVAGLFLTIFGIVATPTILRWMNTDPAIMPEAVTYFRYYFVGALALVLYNVLTGIMNAVGNSKMPLIYLVISSIINVILDYLFIGVFGWGVGAAAMATTISQVVSVILCIIYLVQKDKIYRIEFKKIRFHADVFKEIIKFGLPTGVQNSVIGFANVIVQSNINSFGHVATAGYGAYIKIEAFAFLPITCFSMAMSTFISQNLGAGHKERAKVGARFGIGTSVTLAEITGIIIFILVPVLMRAFTDDEEVIRYGVTQGRIEALFYMFLAYAHCIAGVFRGAGRAIVPMVIMLSIWCLLRITLITIAMKICRDIRLIYIIYPITWFTSCVVFFIFYMKSNWLNGYDGKKKVANE